MPLKLVEDPVAEVSSWFQFEATWMRGGEVGEYLGHTLIKGSFFDVNRLVPSRPDHVSQRHVMNLATGRSFTRSTEDLRDALPHYLEQAPAEDAHRDLKVGVLLTFILQTRGDLVSRGLKLKVLIPSGGCAKPLVIEFRIQAKVLAPVLTRCDRCVRPFELSTKLAKTGSLLIDCLPSVVNRELNIAEIYLSTSAVRLVKLCRQATSPVRHTY